MTGAIGPFRGYLQNLEGDAQSNAKTTSAAQTLPKMSKEKEVILAFSFAYGARP